MPTAFTVRPPAKINLHLRVAPPRADGFHPLLTWMTTIGLTDTLTLSPNTNNQPLLTCTDPALPTDARNLVHRAATLFLQSLGDKSSPISIHLEKRIPA